MGAAQQFSHDEKLKQVLNSLSTLMVKMQAQATQRVRTENHSGVLDVRGYDSAFEAYRHSGYANQAHLSMHDHPDKAGVLGMGSIGAVLNGNHLRTRHLDTKLMMPVEEGGPENFNKLRPIPTPPVPQNVTSKGTIAEQIAEMKEYFYAWQTQNTTHREYKDYFQPAICVLEANWVEDSLSIAESFPNDVADADLDTWAKVSELAQFLSLSGKHDPDGLVGRSPTALREIKTDHTYTMKVNNAAGYTMSPFSLPRVNNVKLYQNNYKNALLNSGSHVTISMAESSQGTFLWIAFGMNGHGGTHKANIGIECLSGGCRTADIEGCGDRSSVRTSCRQKPVDGSVYTEQSVPSPTQGLVAYGPLSGPYELKLSFSGLSGINKVRVNTGVEDGHVSHSVGDEFLLTHEESEPRLVVAHYAYRTFCHPLGHDIPLNRFKVLDDLPAQMYGDLLTVHELGQSRRGHFLLNPRNQTKFYEGKVTYEYLDALMESIPGKDNYSGNLEELSQGRISAHYNNQKEILNVAYYSRYYQVTEKDAMGRNQRRRGFNDANFYGAMNTQPAVSSLSMNDDEGVVRERWSHAIPLEIVFMTPLANFNPYNLPKKSNVAASNRNGGISSNRAFDGYDDDHFYLTPAEFYSGPIPDQDASDTGLRVAGVLDKSGTVREVAAAGHRMFMPPIAGLELEDRIRLRFPIAPFADTKAEGLRNAHALKHAMQSPKLREQLVIGEFINLSYPALTLYTDSDYDETHFHVLKLTADEVKALHNSETILKRTSSAHGHSHALRIAATVVQGNTVFSILSCDGGGVRCSSGHDTVCEIPDQCLPSSLYQVAPASEPALPPHVESAAVVMYIWLALLIIVMLSAFVYFGGVDVAEGNDGF
eukprot:TRINITY_DN1531_c0_g1_i1.p1 TRINITY_DN1531_c0_g1~~TRINITY_DN1531_c0_g1_i1.p1  ORF type:complete len:906 (-),score=202.28 TRINITY_DN1531_c0_g1_i1:175-2799(-)